MSDIRPLNRRPVQSLEPDEKPDPDGRLACTGIHKIASSIRSGQDAEG
ncbi:hypothetical protein NBRC3293_1801 [Gluconobacter oxydans NBRC 3293]|uniref:Uncharacterized protein n=2 Tax=Gluconobacter oxydans TaxID=442 RepID=A0A829WQ77_GLUOY|nr:hypothetical protein GLS_c18490 [Gluconobacter oxydans DSM 3504]GEM17305.1 hypothetical protein NBRC3293_1801 [Gluconobacter oxydans NBRC 3293]